MKIPTDPVEYAKWKEAGGKAEEPKEPEKPVEVPKEEPKVEEPVVETPVKPEPEVVQPEPEEDPEPESSVVPLSKYMSEKNARKERDTMITELSKENERLKGLVPKSERDRQIQEKVKAYAEKTGASEEAAKEFLGIIQDVMGADREAIETFNKERAEEKAKADALNASEERKRKLGKEFESKDFKTFLDEKGITKPEDISTLKKNLVSDALSLPEGVPLKRVYLSGDYSGTFEPKGPTEKKPGEVAEGGNLDKPAQKPVSQMNSAEYAEHKKQQATSQTFRIMGADGKVRHYKP